MIRFIISFLITFLSVFGIDRCTKYLVVSQEVSWWPCQWFGFELVFNKGVAWSFLQDKWELILLLTAASFIFLVGYIIQNFQVRQLMVAESCILAGALSNLLDRFLYGGVVDFIAIHFFGWPFPVFNIADIAICLGGLWILYKGLCNEQSC